MGTHRFATERVNVPKQQRKDKHARFRYLFDRSRPDYLAVRYNALTPPPPRGQQDIFAFAAERAASVLVNKPLAQGLLTGKYDHRQPPSFGPGDHRLRKAWFTPPALQIIQDGLQPLRSRFGSTSRDLVRVALHYCLQHADNAAILVGFTSPEQIAQNLTAVGDPLTADDLDFIRAIAGQLQHALDAAGEVFLDEKEQQEP
ncbi:aldo/keto reductase [Streptomyces sp. ME19-01-6]|uniref:aldo/keto reductase n=1 Tax=Streptomyces sp. ME19-01-6 TaxID=3028686 RepID=UPI0029AB67AE|nr:aldo/keto reductase [Streptomyces sp. ME19-01-6]MDX3224558.1 aldo/keto reductase [Streptomyces sp. ME19-01-6]